MDFLIEGLEFKRDGVVYGKKLDDEFDYELEEGTEIKFTRKDRSHVYYIDKINKDEIGLVGALEFMHDDSCYFKRNKLKKELYSG